MTPEEWIAHDPDPRTAAELAACGAAELACDSARRDCARHGSAVFATVAAEVLAAQGFSVLLLPGPAPTPVVAFAVRHTGAAAGVQITASHNPPTDNGYKVYDGGGIQIVSPTDHQIEAAMADAPPADEIRRTPVPPAHTDLVQRYIEVRRGTGSVRVALTALHGVGGTVAVDALHRAGFGRIHTVASQFAPDPDFPTVAFPNPEEPGATDALLTLAADVDADVAIALDPDADRCAVGIPDASGWRMLSGDETGWLLGDYLLSQPQRADRPVVASTVVSSRMLSAIAARHGAVHVETLTGFKWLARADAEVPGGTLVYAYEEAIGHCVDPAAVRDKDGISAAVLPPPRRARRRRGVAPRRDRRGCRADATAAHQPAGDAGRVRGGAHRHHRRADLHRRRRRHVGQAGGAAFRDRAEGEVLLGDSLRAERRPGVFAAARPRPAGASGRDGAELVNRFGPNWRSPASPRPGTM